MTTVKAIAMTIWTSVGKVISLLFNMQSRFVIGFLPRSKHLFTILNVNVVSFGEIKIFKIHGST